MSRRDRGRNELSRNVIISKTLSFLLRHGAAKERVKMNPEGYVNVADVLAWRKVQSLKITFPEILEVVENSEKKRFALLYAPVTADTERGEGEESYDETRKSAATMTTTTEHALAVKDPDPSHFLIRATQGHSIQTVDSAGLLESLSLGDVSRLNDCTVASTSLPDTVVHGTFHSTWPLILASGGLRRMGRNHIHFATGPSLDEVFPHGREGKPVLLTKTEKKKKPTIISGIRSDAEILIYIDLKKALSAGCPFWRSENGVILSEGIDTTASSETIRLELVPIEFFDVVVERRVGLGILWENGAAVQELPPMTKYTQKNPKGRKEHGD